MKKILIGLTLLASISSFSKEVTVVINIPDSSTLKSCRLTLKYSVRHIRDTPLYTYTLSALGQHNDSRQDDSVIFSQNFSNKNDAVLVSDKIESEIFDICNQNIERDRLLDNGIL